MDKNRIIGLIVFFSLLVVNITSPTPPVAQCNSDISFLELIAYENMKTYPESMTFLTHDGLDECFTDISINTRGDVVFKGWIFDGLNYWQGIYLSPKKQGTSQDREILKIAETGDSTPLGLQTKYYLMGKPTLLDNGDIYFNAAYEYEDDQKEFGLFRYTQGSIITITTSEEEVFKEIIAGKKFDGKWASFNSFDVNNNEVIILDATVRYDEEDTENLFDYEYGLYIKNPQGNSFYKYIIAKSIHSMHRYELPWGDYLGSYWGDIQINDRGTVAYPCWLLNGYNEKINSTILLFYLHGSVSQTISQGQILPLEHISWRESWIPGEENIEVMYIDNFVGLNNLDQISAVVMDQDWNRHLYIWSGPKLNQIHRVIGNGDNAPKSRETSLMISSEQDFVPAAVCDNKVPLGERTDNFSAEVTFITHVSTETLYPDYVDAFSYTSDGKVQTLIKEGEASPDPLQGEVYLWNPLTHRLADLAMNNNGQVLVNAFTKTPEGDYVNAIFLASLDTDGDGLLDSWEKEGIDLNGDNKPELDLPKMGCNYLYKDILVEVDYMQPGIYDYRPLHTSMDAVKEAFKNSPVKNPNNETGINLHINIDEAVPYVLRLNIWDGFKQYKTDWFGSASDRANPLVIKAKNMAFRYCIFTHELGGIATDAIGIADLPGDDFVIALGASSLDWALINFPKLDIEDIQSSVFMHELGHTLGLKHGGIDHINNKPNYLSIMSYSRTIPFYHERPIDYSRAKLTTLDENSLSEKDGIGEYNSYETVYFYDSNNDTINDRFKIAHASGTPIDWNQNGWPNDYGVRSRLNSMLDPPPGYVSIGFLEFDYQELKGHDDWSNLVYGFRHTYNYGAYTSNSDELTWEQVKQILELREALSPIPVLTVNDTILIKNSETIFRGNGSIGKNATVTEYYFDFGDNETSGWILHNQTKHTYTTLGIYNASLSVRDNYGVESIKPAIIEITVTNEQGEIPEPTDPSKPSNPTPRRGLGNTIAYAGITIVIIASLTVIYYNLVILKGRK